MLNLGELLETPKASTATTWFEKTSVNAKNVEDVTMGNQQPSSFAGEGSTTRELCPVEYKLLVFEAPNIRKDEDIVCSALKDAGVARRGITWYYSSTKKGVIYGNHGRVNREVQREMGAKHGQSVLGMDCVVRRQWLWANKETRNQNTDSCPQIVISHLQGRNS